jgi:DNA polymerase mu
MTEEMKQSERFISLSLFESVYGIGPVTARKLYDRGLRSLRDLEAYYEVDSGLTPAEDSESTDMDIRIALGLRDDLMMKYDTKTRMITEMSC